MDSLPDHFFTDGLPSGLLTGKCESHFNYRSHFTDGLLRGHPRNVSPEAGRFIKKVRGGSGKRYMVLETGGKRKFSKVFIII